MITGLLLSIALAAQADTAPASDLADNVRRLVRQLDAVELDVRNHAEEELLRIGPAALAHLPADQTTSAELRQRLERVRQALEKRAADLSVRGSMLSLSGMMTLDEVATAIEKQTGNKIIDYRQKFGQAVTNPRFKLDIQNAPFWQAFDAMLDSTTMSIYQFSGSDGLALIDRPEDELPRATRAAYAGPLRLEVTRIISERHPNKKKDGSLKITMEIAWEPRLTPINFVQPLAQVKAVDEQGQDLKVDSQDASLEAPVPGGGTAVELMIPLSSPARTTKSIASIKGTLTALLAGPKETFEFDKLGEAVKPQFKPLEEKKAAATVILQQVRKNNEVWEVVVRVRFDEAANALESHRNWILQQSEAYLMGPDKMRIDNAGYNTTLRTENEVGMAYQFDLPGGIDGCTLVVKAPSSIHSLQLPYELKNLTLP